MAHPGSYPTTLGFAPWVPRTNVWYTADAKRRILGLVHARMRRLAADLGSTEPLDVSLAWDEELERALEKTNIAPDAPLEPIPRAVLELADHVAITYLTRIRMHARLDSMRQRTAVALTPRAERDDHGHMELQAAVAPNKAYAKYQEAQMRLRERTRYGPLVPPTRNLSGTSDPPRVLP